MDFSEEAYEKRRSELEETNIMGINYLPPYEDLAKMSEGEKRARQIAIEYSPFLYRLLDFDNPTLQNYLETSLVLSELEDFVEGLTGEDARNINHAEHIVELAKRSRSLREALNQLWSSSIYAKASYGKLNVEELGVHASIGNGYLEFEFPFEMLSLSSLYIHNLKKYSKVEQLINARQAWADIISSALARIPMQYRELIYKAEIRVNVLTNKRRMSDPDHFWVRPIIDSFVKYRVICDDKPTSCKFSVCYEFGHKESYLNIQVGKWNESGLPEHRSPNLKTVF